MNEALTGKLRIINSNALNATGTLNIIVFTKEVLVLVRCPRVWTYHPATE